MTDRPNVLWVVFDTARTDAFEPYGAPAGATPVVADLARRGTAHAGVRATASWTLPSHVSMFAGGLPRALGLANVAGISAPAAKPVVDTLRDRWIVELLRRSGYHTAGASANAWITPHSGFDAGFDVFSDVHASRQANLATGSRRERLRWLAEAALAHVDDGARAAERELARWTNERRIDRPFLWFVNLVECHSPYLPPRRYAELGPVGRVQAAREARRYLNMEAFWRACLTGAMPPDDALERMRAGYRGAIRAMDAWLGRVLERLEKTGALDDTLVILCSDHGENFGEGALLGHGFSLDERLISVPFVAAGPGADALEGIRSLAELPARLATVTGLQDHPYSIDALPPLPVAQLDPPSPPRGDPRTESFLEYWQLDQAAADRLTVPLLAAVDDAAAVKLVLRGTHEAFHDLAADPLELTELGADQIAPETVQALRSALAHPAVTESHALFQATGEPAPATDTDDLEERMRLLGYL